MEIKRRWLPTFADLLDRLSIHQLKEVFIPESKHKYSNEMNDIAHDIDLLIKEKNITLSSDLLRAVIVLAQMNEHIWYNEAAARRGEDQDLHKLKLTHGLNGLRNQAMNVIKNITSGGERLDVKVDCLAEEFDSWKISFLEKKFFEK